MQAKSNLDQSVQHLELYECLRCEENVWRSFTNTWSRMMWTAGHLGISFCDSLCYYTRMTDTGSNRATKHAKLNVHHADYAIARLQQPLRTRKHTIRDCISRSH